MTLPSAQWRAGKRYELATLVLDFDEPVSELGMIVDTRIGWQPDAPRTERRQAGSVECSQHVLADCAGRIHAQVDRSTLEQR